MSISSSGSSICENSSNKKKTARKAKVKEVAPSAASKEKQDKKGSESVAKRPKCASIIVDYKELQ